MAALEDAPVGALLPGRVGLFVRLVSQPGLRTPVLATLHSYIDRLGEEPGTEAFLVCLDPDDSQVVWLYEWFRDADALGAHRESDAFAAMMAELPRYLATPPALVRVDPLRLHMQRRVLTGETVDGLY